MSATVAVAIVSWNTSAAACASAAAYLASTGVDARVTIVDNASSEDQRHELRASVPAGAEIRWAGRNLGYGAAANTVLNAAEADFVCASNADLLPSPDMLSQLTTVLAGDAGFGLAAPCFDRRSPPYHAHLPAPGTLPVRALVGRWGHRTVADPPPGALRVVEQPGGACLTARSTTWRALGGFDAGFFLWFEDVDLARRMLDSGLRNVVVGGAQARHQGAGSFVQVDRRLKHAIRLRSLTRYVGKHHPDLLPATRATAALGRLVWVRSGSVAAQAAELERGRAAGATAPPADRA